jgi:hypothetical protein
MTYLGSPYFCATSVSGQRLPLTKKDDPFERDESGCYREYTISSPGEVAIGHVQGCSKRATHTLHQHDCDNRQERVEADP